MLNSNYHPGDDFVIVALGSNLSGHYPSSRALLEAALGRFESLGLAVTGRSRWWRSTAWPGSEDPDYVNGVALVETRLDPRQVMAALLGLEGAFGRARQAPNAARTLDLDLIAHGRSIVETDDLILPHPRAHLRRFVMGPLAEIAPAWIHPALGRTATLLAETAPVGRDASPLHPP